MEPIDRLDDEVLVRRDGVLGHVQLNRPRALNALTQAMVERLTEVLAEWLHDDGVQTVVLSGAGDRGLCAGGDIVAIAHSIRSGGAEAARFWRDEYALDAVIARYPKPFVALMDGLVLGGGVGLSAHGGTRVVTERTRIGMPEVSIGFFPDVGGTLLLARAPGELGTHLALTGGTASGADAIALGLADHLVPSERLAELVAALASAPPAEVIARLAVAAGASELVAQRDWIDEAYSGDDPLAIVERLEASPVPAAREAAATIRTKSPTSVAVTLAAVRRARELASLEAVLERDFRIAMHFTQGHETLEGVRAQVIDKDRTPRWDPARLDDVTAEVVERYFAPLEGRELGLAQAGPSSRGE